MEHSTYSNNFKDDHYWRFQLFMICPWFVQSQQYVYDSGTITRHTSEILLIPMSPCILEFLLTWVTTFWSLKFTWVLDFQISLLCFQSGTETLSISQKVLCVCLFPFLDALGILHRSAPSKYGDWSMHWHHVQVHIPMTSQFQKNELIPSFVVSQQGWFSCNVCSTHVDASMH